MRLAVNLVKRAVPERWTAPIFLCPSLIGIAKSPHTSRRRPQALNPRSSKPRPRWLHVQTTDTPSEAQSALQKNLELLPWTCPGCGAYSQVQRSDEAGYFSTSRKAVRSFVASRRERNNGSHALDHHHFPHNKNPVLLDSAEDLKLSADHKPPKVDIVRSETDYQMRDSNPNLAPRELPAIPVCDRCHDLLHHRKGSSITHPTIQSISDIISESPYKYNHVYHVIDAADFPLSLIPRLHQELSLNPQRSQNRRAKTSKFSHGQKSEMSFIITRSDLLAPTNKQVDSMMPYLTQVLRNALGQAGREVRLGNVRCVSSQRGWWTKQLREEIWERGGAGWLVGKVNVGKSSLFESVFPKGRNTQINFKALRYSASQETRDNLGNGAGILQGPYKSEAFDQHGVPVPISPPLHDTLDLQKESLLPPPIAEVAYPVMPIVSSLPGTTASPIRIPFGAGRGELIDLPGLDRGNLELYVRDEHKEDLVMRQRVKPEQYVVKPGQSILVGGLIRITPSSSDTVLLACPFVPFGSHVTNTEKAIQIHTQQSPSGISSITVPGAGSKMASAGVFELNWDVTKQRAGPLTASSAIGLKPQILPFSVFAADILIEGCGWVELAVQVRKRSLASSDGYSDRIAFPTVEVFSPEGKYVGIRQSMNAWAIGAHHKAKARPGKARPRRSMKGVKKNLKNIARAVE